MGNSGSSQRYNVEFKCYGGAYEIVAYDLPTKEIANTYIVGRAKDKAESIEKYRVVPTMPSPVKGDMKAGLINGKPQLSQFPLAAMIYATRAFEYGNSKYERGNYLRPTVDTLADFDRLLAYIDAGLRHLTKVTLEMNRVRGCTEMSKVDLMAGAICTDLESGLPHLCGAITSIAMGIQQAVDAGLIPADPGRPWEKQKKE